jgi:hypothetical protein
MADNIDALLAEIHTISQQLDKEGLTARQRQNLVRRKDDLQVKARAISLAGRHPLAVANQIESLEARRSHIDDQFIKPGYSEKRGVKNIQDPGAYSHNINRMLQEKYQTELDEIERQLALLRAPLADD